MKVPEGDGMEEVVLRAGSPVTTDEGTALERRCSLLPGATSDMIYDELTDFDRDSRS